VKEAVFEVGVAELAGVVVAEDPFHVGGGPGALALHEAGDVAVQVELGAVNAEVGGVGDAAGEDLAAGPGAVRLAMGEMDHGFLGAANTARGCRSP